MSHLWYVDKPDAWADPSKAVYNITLEWLYEELPASHECWRVISGNSLGNVMEGLLGIIWAKMLRMPPGSQVNATWRSPHVSEQAARGTRAPCRPLFGGLARGTRLAASAASLGQPGGPHPPLVACWRLLDLRTLRLGQRGLAQALAALVAVQGRDAYGQPAQACAARPW